MIGYGGPALKGAEIKVRSQAVDAIGVRMIAVETEFESNPLDDEDGACHADGKPGDVQEGVNPMPADVPQRVPEVV